MPLTPEVLQSENVRQFYTAWRSGMSAAKALDRAFGEGTTSALSREVWIRIRTRNTQKKEA